ncbi:MAG: hypothetical protein ACUVQ6_02290 [Dissulfurimicrobium sp.]
MGIVWFGYYTNYLKRHPRGYAGMYGLSCEDFYIAGLRASIV